MRSDRRAEYLSDIVTAAGHILDWCAQEGGAEHAIMRNLLTRSAIERQFLVISEAASRLTAISERTGWLLPEGIDWSGVRGIGNLIRHRYDEIQLPILLDIAQNKLQDLRQRCADASEGLGAAP